MQDDKGIYYYAQPGNNKVKVYIRKNDHDEIEFRLWEAEHPEVWEKHGWLPYSVIQRASALYRKERNADANPLNLYDLGVASALLGELKS